MDITGSFGYFFLLIKKLELEHRHTPVNSNDITTAICVPNLWTAPLANVRPQLESAMVKPTVNFGYNTGKSTNKILK